MADKTRVVVADDHPLVRKGIIAMLLEEEDFEIVGEATNGESTHILCERLKPDILLLDLNMPGVPTLETMAIVRLKSPTTKIIILTAFSDLNSLRNTISAGAMGYLLKDEGLDIVIQAIRTVMQGGRQFSQSALMKLVNSDPPEGQNNVVAIQRTLTLNEREIALLRLVASGKEDHEIGKTMGIAERTVRHQMKIIFEKLGVQSRLETIVYLARLGWLKEQDEN